MLSEVRKGGFRLALFHYATFGAAFVSPFPAASRQTLDAAYSSSPEALDRRPERVSALAADHTDGL
jgi:hypothetical protein